MVVSTENVWESFSENLRGFIGRRVRDPNDVEDVLQTVFLKIHNNISGLRNSNNLDAWVYRIARHAIVDHYRSRTQTMYLGDIIDPSTDDTSYDAGVTACVRPMIDALPEKYQQALILTGFRGLTQRELAEHLGLSLSGAKSRVQRGRELVREMLLDCCELEFDRRGGIVDYEPKDSSCMDCA